MGKTLQPANCSGAFTAGTIYFNGLSVSRSMKAPHHASSSGSARDFSLFRVIVINKRPAEGRARIMSNTLPFPLISRD
jgi:hypothetical protein